MSKRAQMALEWLSSLIHDIEPESDPRNRFSVAERKGRRPGHLDQERSVRLIPVIIRGANDMPAFGPTPRPMDVVCEIRIVVKYPHADDDLVTTSRMMSDAARLLIDLHTDAVLNDGTAFHVSSHPQDEGVFGSELPESGNRLVPTFEIVTNLRYTEGQ